MLTHIEKLAFLRHGLRTVNLFTEELDEKQSEGLEIDNINTEEGGDEFYTDDGGNVECFKEASIHWNCWRNVGHNFNIMLLYYLS